jgi:DNA-binding TFAR19-related protein (PDSD5 family)
MSEEEDPDLRIIKARKMKELQRQAATQEKMKARVLALAKSQFPIQTRAIVRKIVELIKAGEINQRISGGELLALFRSVGMNIRVNTSIRIEDHGKLVSFSDKLKYENEDSSTA